MTILVSVKINDGVVMAADSASSFESGMVYQNADKIVNLMERLPIGAMATGAGGIGNESIDTLMKDLRRRFSGAAYGRGCAFAATPPADRSLKFGRSCSWDRTLQRRPRFKASKNSESDGTANTKR
jgi:hypothetical protein